MLNPWVNICWSDTIADCDKEEYNKLTQKQKDCLQTQLLPEPYWGDPQGDILFLCGNPGYSVTDNCFVGNPDFEKLLKEVYSHQDIRAFWLEDSIIPKPICPVSRTEITHEGIKWWKRKIGKVKQLKETPFFVAEYFPYHSKESASFMRNSKRWASSDYTNFIISRFIEEKKPIIIMRWEAEWKDRIKELDGYKKLIVVKSKRSATISEHNLKEDGWKKLMASFK